METLTPTPTAPAEKEKPFGYFVSYETFDGATGLTVVERAVVWRESPIRSAEDIESVQSEISRQFGLENTPSLCSFQPLEVELTVIERAIAALKLLERVNEIAADAPWMTPEFSAAIRAVLYE